MGIRCHYLLFVSASATFEAASHCCSCTQHPYFHHLWTAGLRSLIMDFPWGSFKRVLDIGGAGGTALAAVTQSHPHMTGVLFDQPQVLPRSHPHWMWQDSAWARKGQMRLTPPSSILHCWLSRTVAISPLIYHFATEGNIYSSTWLRSLKRALCKISIQVEEHMTILCWAGHWGSS